MTKLLLFIGFCVLCSVSYGSSQTVRSTGKCGKSFTWVLDENAKKLTISGSGTLSECDVSDSWKAKIESIVIENGAKKLDMYVFKNYVSLSSITLPNSLTTIDHGAFTATSLKTFHLPKSVTTLEGTAFFNCTKLKSFTVDSESTSFCAIDGVLFKHDMKEIVRYPPAKKGTSFDIPSTVTSLGNCCFQDCIQLRHVTIPEGADIIRQLAFRLATNLKSIVIPSSMLKIDHNAFNGCSELSYVRFLGKRGIKYGDKVFDNCPKFSAVCVEPDYLNKTFCGYPISKECVEPSESESESGSGSGTQSKSGSADGSCSFVPSIALLLLAVFILI